MSELDKLLRELEEKADAHDKSKTSDYDTQTWHVSDEEAAFYNSCSITVKKLIAVIRILRNETSDNTRSVCEKIVKGDAY